MIHVNFGRSIQPFSVFIHISMSCVLDCLKDMLAMHDQYAS